jgi:NADH-quinone oxidoreductase subunit G
MSEDLVNIEVNGVPLKARKGQMIMQATDPADIYIPRFCYHEKLSRRRQLPHVPGRGREGAEAAAGLRDAGRRRHEGLHQVAAGDRRAAATMEFLLINHPLDCPICDQGGECELQDLAMGYGRDISRFAERKRVGQGQESGAAGLDRHDALHPLHALRALRPGNRRDTRSSGPPAAASTWRSAPTSSTASITSCRPTSSICARSARSTTSRSATTRAPGR